MSGSHINQEKSMQSRYLSLIHKRESGEGNLSRGRSRAENFGHVSIPLSKALEW